MREEDIRPTSCAAWVIPALVAAMPHIEQGVLMTLDPRKRRMRLLPLVR